MPFKNVFVCFHVCARKRKRKQKLVPSTRFSPLLMMNISSPHYKLSISYFQHLCKDFYTWCSSTLFSFQLALPLHIMSSHFLSATYWASLWGVLSGFVLFDGSQWCCTQHPSADILIRFPISCWKTPSHCWWDTTLRRSTVLKEDIKHDNPWKTFLLWTAFEDLSLKRSLEQYCKTV